MKSELITFRKNQIEEMAKDVCRSIVWDRWEFAQIDCLETANILYNKGYRKQSEGEWNFEFNLDDDDFYKCSVCGRQEVINGLCKERNPVEHYPYCHCGVKMKGGEADA